MQSGFGVIFLMLARRSLGKLPVNLMANFDSELFGLVFPGFQATQKIHAQKIHVQNCRHSSPIFVRGKRSHRARNPEKFKVNEKATKK